MKIRSNLTHHLAKLQVTRTMFVWQVFLYCSILSLSLGYSLEKERVERGDLEGQ
jgi:hypothetical protein